MVHPASFVANPALDTKVEIKTDLAKLPRNWNH
jgi:hypothetical protein